MAAFGDLPPDLQGQFERLMTSGHAIDNTSAASEFAW
jgi:hypothetical protein